MSELASDVSPAAAIQAVPMTLSSGLDLKSVYHPPSTLQLPGGGTAIDSQDALSHHESMSSSSSQSSIGSSHGIQKDLAVSAADDASSGRTEDKSDDVFNVSDSDTVVPGQGSPDTRMFVEAPVVANIDQGIKKVRPSSIGVLPDRSLSTGSSGSGSGGGGGGGGTTTRIAPMQETNRQSSQTSLFEQLASQAKELVRESTRQGSQERLLAQMDKVDR